MAFTRGNLLDRITALIGDSSTEFRSYLETSFNLVIDQLFDMHDWNWKHGAGTLNTAASTETYTISAARSSQDIEVIWDTANKRFLQKTEVRLIKKTYPDETESNEPTHYASWGAQDIYLHPIPNDAYTLKLLFINSTTHSTSDSDDIESDLGIPKYMHFMLEKMLMSEAFLYQDDSRYKATEELVENLWKRRAIKADMQHLESSARFKFWEEELAPEGITYDDYLKKWWWRED